MAGAAQLPNATALGGELILWETRLACERLHTRLQWRGAGAAQAADEWPEVGSGGPVVRRELGAQQNQEITTAHP